MQKTSRPKIIDLKMIHLLMEKKDGRGERVPFSIVYLCRDGSIMRDDNVVCAGVNRKQGTRTLKFLSSQQEVGGKKTAQIRTIRDCLILSVNGFRVVVS